MSTATEDRAHLDELLAKMEALKQEHTRVESVLREEINTAHAAWCRTKWAIGAGDIIVTIQGTEALVESIYCGGHFNSRPWLLVKKKTKGGWAKNVTAAYDWRQL